MLFGAHVSSGGGVGRAPERAVELGCEAFQIFTQNSRTWRQTEHSEQDVASFRERAPAVGRYVETPEGRGVVRSYRVPADALLVRLEGADRDIEVQLDDVTESASRG